MNKLFAIIVLLVSAACATEVKITPQPYTYIDCVRLGSPEQFCRDTATP